MKQIWACAACLAALVILLGIAASVHPAPIKRTYSTTSEPVVDDPQTDLGHIPYAVMVDGVRYYSDLSGDGDANLLVKNSRIDGHIQSTFASLERWPQENGQANFEAAQDAPYALIDGVLFVKINDTWRVFLPVT